MTVKQALSKLKALGSAQTRKTYGRHGVTGEMFGVKFGDLGKLARQIKVDHGLALELWDSGNHDARVLATMIVDTERVTAKLLDAWIKDVDNHVLSHALATVASGSAAGAKVARRWAAVKGEWKSSTGWMALAGIASHPGGLSATEARGHLEQIESRIHGSPNRTKYSMNTAMIAIGTYIPGLEELAIKAAERIGQVEVDHGLTACQTPYAVPYIRKAAAHHRAKLAKSKKNRS